MIVPTVIIQSVETTEYPTDWKVLYGRNTNFASRNFKLVFMLKSEF